MYDYLVVGAGLFGAIFAYEANKRGKKVLVIDKRSHIGGNVYTEKIEGINVHKYGAHIFHTDNQYVWDYINKFARFNRFTNSPIAIYDNKVYNLPFNMNTFNQLWGVRKPKEAKEIISKQVEESGIKSPKNLEEQAIFLAGYDIYEKLIKGYTEKQWGKKAHELPSFIIKRIPLRFVYDNNYFNDQYQGIPIGGYSQIFEKLLSNIEVRLNVDFIKDRDKYQNIAKRILYTGMIDEYYDYQFGKLEYRTLRFDTKVLDTDNFQGNAVVNYTNYDVPYTRIIEHKHFEFAVSEKTVVTYEYPLQWKEGSEPFYPINDERNSELLKKYTNLSENDSKVIFGGRLGKYKYYDMDDVIEEVIKLVEKELK